MTAPKLVVLPDAGTVAARGAELLAEVTRAAVAARGTCSLALSGGGTPWIMFSLLRDERMPWSDVTIYQVDERVAPAGDPERNLTHLLESLPAEAASRVLPMPVDAADLELATAEYASSLPERLDLVHLGLGADGHTASLVPGDHVLEVTDRDVAVAGPYQGRRRMTLTFRTLARARQLLWVVTGEDKAEALHKLLAGDPSIPAGRVPGENALVLADAAAARAEL